MAKPAIVVFGAAGRFNQIFVPRLLDEGFEVRAVDILEMSYPCECVQASTVDYGAVERACEGMDIAVNAAGLHYLPRGTDHPENYQAYWETNYTGTQNVYLAALCTGIRKVIFSSSVNYYDMRCPGVIDEDSPAARPAPSIYDLSKVVGEDIGRFYAAGHGIQTVALRYGNFCGDPEPDFDFLYLRLRREDTAQSNYQALFYVPENGFEAFTIVAGCPFQPDDLESLEKAPMDVLEKYYPGFVEFAQRKGITWTGQKGFFCMERARTRLGYKPEFTFETYLKRIGFTA